MKKKETPIKNQLEVPKHYNSPLCPKTPRKNDFVSEQKKTKPTPLKTLNGSEQEQIQSTDKEEFLMLQIKQLKRQNNFLKKKIAELTPEWEAEQKRLKRPKQKQKGALNANLQIMPLSINFFFQEIHNLLNTIVKLFRIEFTQQQIQMYNEKHCQQIKQTCPIKKHSLLKKYFLKRKLERILLERQENRYPLFIDLFTEYYSYKQQSDQKIIETIDTLTQRAHELNQTIIQKAQQKRRSRGTLSTIKQQDQLPVEATTSSSPQQKNFVALNKISVHSPSVNRKLKKGTKFSMSPNEKGQKNTICQ